MKGEISRNESNAAALAVSHAIPLLVSAVVYAVIAVLSVMMCSCGGQTNSKLKEAVAMANSMCPIDYGNGSKLESIKYDESRNEATMTLSVDNGIVDIATLKSNEANVKKLLCASFSQGCGNQWMIELANAGASFKVVFNEMSGKTVEILFTPEEVKKIAKGNVPTADMPGLGLMGGNEKPGLPMGCWRHLVCNSGRSLRRQCGHVHSCGGKRGF